MDGDVLGTVASCPKSLKNRSCSMLDAVGFFVEYVVVVLARLTVDIAGSILWRIEFLRLSRLNVGETVLGCAGAGLLLCCCPLESLQRFRWASSICLLRRS